MIFSNFLKEYVLNEGGNAAGLNKKTNISIDAQKIDFKKIPIQQFRKEFFELFREFNKLFKRKFNEDLWKSDDLIKSGILFNGSTSYIMNPNMEPDEILKYKGSSGDIDIMIPEHQLQNVWYLLDDLEGKKISNFTYHGCNKQNPHAIGDQINAVFIHNETDIACQVDFEAAEFKDHKPSAWASFAHGSSFEDAKQSIKAAFHKLLLRALVGSASENPNIVIATKSSVPGKIKLKKSTETPREMAFSVVRGLRQSLEPMLDNGEPIYINGKQVFKEIDTDNSEFITSLEEIFHHIFKAKGNLNDLNSFIGVVKLMKKYCDKQTLQNTQKRFFEIIFGMGAQIIESRNKEDDKHVKLTAYEYFLKNLGLKHPGLEKDIERYYAVKWRD